MTKTLTEQWREGKLPDGKYYIKLEPNFTERYDVGYSEGGDFSLYNIEDIEEILAPVPSYDEWHKVKDLGLRPDYTDHIEKWEDCARLTKQLAIAKKALERYSKDDYYSEGGGRSVNPYPHIARKALKEMEGVK